MSIIIVGGFHMWKEIFLSAAGAVGVTLALLILTDVFAILGAFFQKKKAEAQAEQNQMLTAAYDMAIRVLDSITQTTLSRIETTKAAAIRQAVKNGEKGYTELTGLSEEAYQDIVRQLSPSVEKALEGCVKNTEALIRNKIEELLPEVKERYKLIGSAKETKGNVNLRELLRQSD